MIRGEENLYGEDIRVAGCLQELSNVRGIRSMARGVFDYA
jgi:hypothetical protein